MRIEQITKQSLMEAEDKELSRLRSIFVKLWDKHFKFNKSSMVGSLDRNDTLAKYRMLHKEIRARDIKHGTEDIDHAGFAMAMEIAKAGLDVSVFEDLVSDPCIISVDEDFTKQDEIQVTMHTDFHSKILEEHIAKCFEEQLDKSCVFVYTTDFEGECVPLYKHVLSPVEKIQKATVSKDVTKEKEGVKKFEAEFVPIVPIEKGDEHIVYGVVYEPDTVDVQGDEASEKEIRKAAYQFMEDVQIFKVNHKGTKVKAQVLENYIAPVEFSIAGRSIKKGSWVLVTRVLDKQVWKDIKDGHLTGYSMAGYAKSS